ncbi:prepilin-type N-terminal cleavage/methylation domain-containing protein [Lactobacillus delbrueckii]|nr:prepilin-type N-terminal cleavage/methylation domain-containing protein [Lactobacillus delbrueckii]
MRQKAFSLLETVITLAIAGMLQGRDLQPKQPGQAGSHSRRPA